LLQEEERNNELAEDEDAEPHNLHDIIDEGQEIETVRKENVFAEEVTEEEQTIIEKRVALQRKHYMEYERREIAKRYKKVHRVHPYVTGEEVVYALKECKNEESEVIMYFTDYYNLQNIRKQIAMDYEKKREKQRANSMSEFSADEGRFISRKRKNTPSRARRSGDKKEGTYVYRKLRLDDALAQGNFEGWSHARIRAYQLRGITIQFLSITYIIFFRQES
jgi:hypothetical protein